jgi:hypothetical protein
MFSAAGGIGARQSLDQSVVKVDSIVVNETGNAFVNLLLQTRPTSLEVRAGEPFGFNLTVAFFRTLDEGNVYTNATAIQGVLRIVTPGFTLLHVYGADTRLATSRIIVPGDATLVFRVEVSAPNTSYRGPLSLVLEVTPFTA